MVASAAASALIASRIVTALVIVVLLVRTKILPQLAAPVVVFQRLVGRTTRHTPVRGYDRSCQTTLVLRRLFMPCTALIITLLEPFRGLFTAPTWKKLLTLPQGTLLARGRRTVTTALWYTGHEQDPNFSVFHHVLNRARWSPLQASRQLLALIIDTFIQAGGSLDIVIDETVERRWGPKIRKRGHYRDSALSSHERSVSSPGLRWIVLAVVVSVPWTTQRWALPFLCLLATTPEVSAKLGIRHKTLGIRARQAVSLFRRWL